jgi:hypothetical protein
MISILNIAISVGFGANKKTGKRCDFRINPTRDGDDYNGYLAITHHNGDQTFVKYDGSWKWALPKDGYSWISESKGRFTGGTGKFEGISGTITVKVEGNGQSYLSSKWEAEYEITSNNN